MDPARLRTKLKGRTELIIGPIAETVPRFVMETQEHPVGFIAVDMELGLRNLRLFFTTGLPPQRVTEDFPDNLRGTPRLKSQSCQKRPACERASH
jgi:hypothetical protein